MVSWEAIITLRVLGGGKIRMVYLVKLYLVIVLRPTYRVIVIARNTTLYFITLTPFRFWDIIILVFKLYI